MTFYHPNVTRETKSARKQFFLKLNLFKPLAILLLDRMLRLKSYMKHADNINFRQVQSSNPLSWVHWQYCTLSSQSFTKMYEFPSRRDRKHAIEEGCIICQEESAVPALSVLNKNVPWCKDKQLNFVGDISLICFLPTKSWHDVVFIFLRLRRQHSNRRRSKQRRVTWV